MRTLVSALSKSDTSWYEAGQLCRIEPWPWKPSIPAFPVLMVWSEFTNPYDMALKLPSLALCEAWEHERAQSFATPVTLRHGLIQGLKCMMIRFPKYIKRPPLAVLFLSLSYWHSKVWFYWAWYPPSTKWSLKRSLNDSSSPVQKGLMNGFILCPPPMKRKTTIGLLSPPWFKYHSFSLYPTPLTAPQA